MVKLADVPKLRVISSAPSPVDPHLKYPNGSNFDEEVYCYGLSFPDAHKHPNQFSIILYKCEDPTISKEFHFTGTDRVNRVLKHMDSLTNQQIKDFLKDK